jgi:hypothetical protein
MVASEIAAGLSAFKTMFDMAKALKDMDTAAARNAAVIELQEKIFVAQAAQTSLISRVSELEEQVRSFETWDAEKQRYELHDAGRGIMTYRLKADAQPPEPAHEICPDCYQRRVKFILGQVTRQPGMCKVALCQGCGWEAYLQGAWHKEHGPTKSAARGR